jgi:hypothetical protein
VGQQQLLLIILGVIIVGVAIAVGIALFSDQSISSNRDAIESDLMNLGADCYQFRIRPTIMGGGGGTYVGYTIAATGEWGTANPNATYSITRQTPEHLNLLATSKEVSGGTVTLVFNGEGGIDSGPTASF